MNQKDSEVEKQVNEIRSNQKKQIEAYLDGGNDKIEDYDDVIFNIQQLVIFLKKQGNGRGASRSASLAITKLEEAEMWLDRHLDEVDDF